MIFGITQLAYFEIITGKTIGKLPWKIKVPLQRNGMAAIPKINLSNGGKIKGGLKFTYF